MKAGKIEQSGHIDAEFGSGAASACTSHLGCSDIMSIIGLVKYEARWWWAARIVN